MVIDTNADSSPTTDSSGANRALPPTNPNICCRERDQEKERQLDKVFDSTVGMKRNTLPLQLKLCLPSMFKHINWPFVFTKKALTQKCFNLKDSIRVERIKTIMMKDTC
jgi:hypothetical protein